MFIRLHHKPNTPLSGQVRLPGLDVVRAIAITLVFVSHFGMSAAWVSGLVFPQAAAVAGIFGVEVFFALSGFLIGGLLIQIVERGPTARGWLIFMIRRWIRTIPLYLLWIAVLIVVAPPPAELPILTIFSHLSLLQNFAWPSVGNDWFAVSWSLMVEEWFYLLFSAALMLIAQRWRSQAILVTCLLFIVSPYLIRGIFFWLSYVPSEDWDKGLRKIVVFRLDAIAYGVLVAWAHKIAPIALARWRFEMLAVGVVLIALMWVPFFGLFKYSEAFMWLAYFPLVSIGAALCIPAALHVAIPPSGWMRSITWLSERSYGLYIVHFSLIAILGDWFYQNEWSLIAAVFTAFVLSLGLADLSYRYFESPLLANRPKQP
jgi:peptidoglycan/LPS O-acetylase OafA/YrhL